MSKLLDKVTFGPFEAAYHRRVVDDAFRRQLFQFLEERLLPQVTLNNPVLTGSVTAFADADRNCGPNSAVKYIYRLNLTFRSGAETEDIDVEICHRPEADTFSVRGRRPFYLWTVERKRQRAEYGEKVESLLREVAEGLREVRCPICHVPVEIVDNADIFSVGCQSGCFWYHVHRENIRQLRFVTRGGMIFMKDPP